MTKDIFISYKNDNAGNNFAFRLKGDLEKSGYSVYFNPDESGTKDFPEKLRAAVSNCKDFIIIISEGCLRQLKQNDKIDWIREELLIAKHLNKNIIPILLDKVEMPKDSDEMPEQLRFFPKIDAITLPEQYMRVPYMVLTGSLQSRPEKDDRYRDVYNSNEKYDVLADFRSIKARAEQNDYEAMYELYTMYFYGLAAEDGSSDRNYEQAYRWANELTKTENPYRKYAYSMVSRMYYSGLVPWEPQSYEKALALSEMAADDYGLAAQHVAHMYSLGLGCEYDYKKTIQFYRQLSAKGDAATKASLADFYKEHGRYKEAEQLYQEIWNIRPKAAFELGKLYKTGVPSKAGLF